MRPGEELLDDPIEWGRLLIQTNDHDPLYVGLSRWDVKGSRLRRFLLAYWSCYSVGASWWLSQHSGTRFWNWLEVAARNEEPSPIGGRWPRAHERRHWRGQKCVESVAKLRTMKSHPEELVLSLEGFNRLNEVERAVTQWPQFGPWIAFKAADMLERVLGCPIWFPDDIITLYKDPRKGADMAAEVMGLAGPAAVIIDMYEAYGGMIAPGFGDNAARLVNIQEIETVLCKWKSARNGHYWIGMDTQSHRSELENWGAQDLLDVYPRMDP